MKKIISILALVLAITALMSISVLADEPEMTFDYGADYVADPNVTVTPAADSIAVTLNDAVEGADYSILLVSGNSLPTVDSEIAYINQANATSTSVAFSVLPNLNNCGAEMKIYIGTNAENKGLIEIPVTYKAVVVEPPVVEPEISIADVTADGDITIGDAMEVVYFVNWEASLLDAMDYDTVAVPIADITGDGDITIGDAMEIIYYVNWEASLLDTILQ